MKTSNSLMTLLICLAFICVSCDDEPEISPPDSNASALLPESDAALEKSNTKASKKAPSPSYQFLIYSGILCEFFPCPGFDQAAASNGDIIELSGQGTLSVHPKSASGGGTFAHRNANGDILGMGNWTATDLISFKEFGPSPVRPPEWRAGASNIRIHLVDDLSGAEFDAILKLDCILPEAKVPPSLQEGLRVNILGSLNFNQLILGPTLFIIQE